MTGRNAGMVRRALGRELKAMRLKAGKTHGDLVTVASPAKLKRMEAGEGPLRMPDIRALCFLCSVDAATTEQLCDMSLKTNEQGFWEEYSDVMPPRFGMYVGLEASANDLFVYDGELVFGLLQTPEYHRAVFQAEGWPSSDSADRQIKLRQERQKAAFERPDPLHVVSVLGEGALVRDVGGKKVMEEQRQYLLTMSRQQNVEVYVLQWGAGAHNAMKGAFTVLGFDNAADPDVAYVETYLGGRYVEGEAGLNRYRHSFDQVRAQSVTIEEYLR